MRVDTIVRRYAQVLEQMVYAMRLGSREKENEQRKRSQ
jgi:hypothetical protein